MTTDTSNVEPRGGTASLSTDAIFELLLDEHRRGALEYLSRTVGAVSIDELTAQLAIRDGDRTRDRRDAIRTRFHHSHLPKLLETGVVRYDPAAGTIERRAAAASLDPYLELAKRGA